MKASTSQLSALEKLTKPTKLSEKTMNSILGVNLCIFLVKLVFNCRERPVMKNSSGIYGKSSHEIVIL